MKQKTILVTGAAGNIGSSLALKLIQHDFIVVGVDNLSTGNRIKLGNYKEIPNLNFIKADVNDYNQISAIFHKYHFDYVFHFAAVVGVKRTIENPVKVLNDIKGIDNILNLCKNTGVERVFYSSSSEVYGEPVTLPQNEETTPLNSRLPYAIVKNIGEAYCRSFYKEFDLPYTIFRFFNTYGPNQSEDFVLPKFLNQALKNKDITVYGDGSQTRTFCYIDDNIDTIIHCLSGNLFINDTINIGSDEEISVLDLANLVLSKSNSSGRVIYLPALEDGDMTRRMPDNSKMKQILKRELVTINEGIDKMLKFRFEKQLPYENNISIL